MLPDSTLNYLSSTTDKIPGWMIPFAGRVTAELIAHQTALGITGAMFEIGVVGGKYLSVLYDNARAANSILLAIDPFQHFNHEQVLAHLGTSPGDPVLKFYTGFSTDLDATDIRALLNSKARFVSLDGSHDASDVIWDLELAYNNLHPQGIISVDDFLNTECLGVVEAVGRFLSHKPNIAPLLFTSNKLFLTPLKAVSNYKELILRFANECPLEGRNKEFLEKHGQNPKWASSDFFGHSLFVI